MNSEEQVRRGGEAQRLLRDAIYVEAYATIRERLISQLSQIETTGEKRERLNNLLVALETVRRYVEQVAMGGKMAAEQIERERSIGERIVDGIRRIA